MLRLLSLSVTLSAGLALATACSSSGGSSNNNPLGCPSSPPSTGSCALASGTTCTYPGEGPCGYATVAACVNGSWEYQAQGGAPVEAACPAAVPAEGTACSAACGGAQPSCSYGCDQGGPAEATCSGGVWQVARSNIACPVDAGIDSPDASPGDAAADGPTSCTAPCAGTCGAGTYCHWVGDGMGNGGGGCTPGTVAVRRPAHVRLSARRGRGQRGLHVHRVGRSGHGDLLLTGIPWPHAEGATLSGTAMSRRGTGSPESKRPRTRSSRRPCARRFRQ